MRAFNTAVTSACVSLQIALAGLVSVAAQAATPYNAPQPLNRPGSADTQPWDINDAGTIVGWSTAGAFSYANGVFSSLSLPVANLGVTATGITNAGMVVGNYSTGDVNSPTSHGFLLDDGIFSTFDLPGVVNTNIRHVSSDGRYLSGISDNASISTSDGFVYDRQTSTLTHLLNDGSYSGVIVQGVNRYGQVTGSFVSHVVNGHMTRGAFIYDLLTQALAEFTDVAGRSRPRFRDINDNGLITGFVGTDAFVGTPGDWFIFSPTAGQSSVVGYGLNNSGVAVGFALADITGQILGGVATPVPEPATGLLWMLGGGFVALAVRRRQRQS